MQHAGVPRVGTAVPEENINVLRPRSSQVSVRGAKAYGSQTSSGLLPRNEHFDLHGVMV